MTSGSITLNSLSIPSITVCTKINPSVSDQDLDKISHYVGVVQDKLPVTRFLYQDFRIQEFSFFFKEIFWEQIKFF